MDRIVSLSASLAWTIAFFSPAAAAAAVSGEAFVHTADTEPNQYGTFVQEFPYSTVSTISLVTHRVEDGLFAPLNPNPVGIFPHPLANVWVIFNENHADLPDGAKFNVFVAEDDVDAVRHAATADNVSSSWTTIEHPLSGDPDTLVFVTPAGESQHPQPIGVWYDESGHWAIFNEDESAMELHHQFNVVLVGRNAPDAFVHTAASATIDGPITTLDHPLTNGRPDAMLFVTQSWNPPGSEGVYNDAVVAIHYDSAAQRWTIFNASAEPMPPGASFNVLVVPEPAELAQAAAALLFLGASWRRRRGANPASRPPRVRSGRSPDRLSAPTA
jgi:hypothetical protein